MATAIPTTPLALTDQCTNHGATILLAKILNHPKNSPAIEVRIITPITEPAARGVLCAIAFAAAAFDFIESIVGKMCHKPKIAAAITNASNVGWCCSKSPSSTPLNNISSTSAVPSGILTAASNAIYLPLALLNFSPIKNLLSIGIVEITSISKIIAADMMNAQYIPGNILSRARPIFSRDRPNAKPRVIATAAIPIFRYK